MSNTNVKYKMIRQSKITPSLWIDLAEDAEREIAKARERIKQLGQAARIFRRNAESGVASPSTTHN